MASSSRSAERFKYGICLNDECPLCKEKKVQQIPMRKDLVCSNPECGKPLRECPPPPPPINWKKIVAIVAGVIIIGGGVAFFALSGGEKSEPVPPQPDPKPIAVVDSDSIRRAQVEAENQRLKDSLAAIEAEKAKEQEAKEKETKEKEKTTPTSVPPKPASKSKDLGYATFNGTWPNDVNGRMIFKTSHIIDSKDPKGRVAEAGDYVIGEFADGHLVQGIWYGADNQVKGSVIIGR